MKKSNKLKLLGSIVFLIWFFGTIVLMILNENNVSGELILFGQAFIIFGLIAVMSSKKTIKTGKDLVLVTFPLVGLVCFVVGIIIKFKVFNTDNWFPYLISIGFIVIGLFIIIGRKLYDSYLRRACTEEAFGEIVDIDTIYDDGHNLYAPIYEINYRNEKIRVKPDEYTNINKYVVGRIETLIINPENPNEFIYPHTNSIKLVYAIGFLVVIGGIIPILALFGVFG